MGLDKNNIPDEYLCEVCKPRPIDRKRAKAMQTRRRTELFNNSSSSEDNNLDSRKVKTDKSGPNRRSLSSAKGLKKGGLQKPSAVALNHKKMLDKKAVNSGLNNKKPGKVKKGKETNAGVTPAAVGASLLEKSKKQYKKRKSTSSSDLTSNSTKKVSPKKSAIARRKSQTFNDSDLDSDAENNLEDNDDEDRALEPNVEASQNLRSWIDQYEEAVTNHYSPELRARLSRLQGQVHAMASLSSDLRSSALGGPTRCNVSLKGNGVKILTAVNHVNTNAPIIECKGRFMLASQYRNHGSKKSEQMTTPPYVFFYKLGDILDICMDGKTYGNDGRFCRRSATHNAELRHIIDKGNFFVKWSSSCLSCDSVDVDLAGKKKV